MRQQEGRAQRPGGDQTFIQNEGPAMNMLEHELIGSRQRELQVEAEAASRARRLYVARRAARRAERAIQRAARASAAVY